MKPASLIPIILSAILLALPALADTTQSGLVQEYNEKAKKTPLEGVELNVRNANNAISATDGSFRLQFLSMNPGDRVKVRRIEKLGYEIFNKEALEQWNLNPKTPFVIILCRSDKFKKIRDNYEKVSSESYARQLKKEEAALAKLKAEGKLKEEEYSRQLAELRDSYEDQLDKLESYIDRFSRIDLSELSATEQEIITLVQDGRIDEAIQKYEEQNYVEQYTEQIKEIKLVENAINDLTVVKTAKEETCDTLLNAIERQIETLKLAGGRDNFEKIASILEKVAYSDTTNIENMFSYAAFMGSQHEYEKATAAYRTIINNASDPAYKFKILINLSNLYTAQSEFDKALAVIDEAAPLASNLNEKSMAYLLAARGGIAYQRIDFNGALEKYTDALKLVEGSGDVIEGDVYFTISSIYRVLKQYDKALDFSDKSKRIFENLENENPSKYTENLMKIRKNEASIYFYAEKYEECHNAYSSLKEDYRKLYEVNPKQYAKEYSWNQVMLAKCLAKEEKHSDAIAELDIVLPIYESLYSGHPLAYGKHYMQCLNDYGLALKRCDRQSDAEAYSDKAMSVAQNLYSIDPGAFVEIYISSLYNHGYLAFKTQKYTQALDFYSKAMELERPLYDRNPRKFGNHFTSIMMYIGRSHIESGNYSVGLEMQKSVCSIRKELAEKNLGITHLELAECHRYLGEAYQYSELSEDAINSYETALSHYKAAMESQPKWKSLALEMIGRIANIHDEKGNHEEAAKTKAMAESL